MLRSLPFTDLILTGTESLLKGQPGSSGVTHCPPACFDSIKALRDQLRAESERNAGLDWMTEFEGIQFRVKLHRGGMANEQVYYLRRHKTELGSLSQLGYPNWLQKQLLSPELKQGLVVFAGDQGAGKTTGAATFIHERMNRFGGTAVTVECPVEIRLQGFHGEGWVHQVGVESESKFSPAIVESYRCSSPNLLFLGEIRESNGCAEAIKAACTSYLVVTTVHSSGIVEAFHRLATFASAVLGKDEVCSMLGEAFSLCIHQDLSERLRVRTLSATDAVRAKLRSGAFVKLQDDIQAQSNQRRSGLG